MTGVVLQLNPPIPVETPRGLGYAHGWCDYSQEHDMLWIVCLNVTGEWWHLPQSQVRGVKNYSMGRTEAATPFKP